MLRPLHPATASALPLPLRQSTLVGSISKSCETCGTNIIPYPLSTGPNCGDPMYFNFFCNFSTGQVSFRTLGDNFQVNDFLVNNINPKTHKFVIEVKDKDCGARNSKYLQLSPASPFQALNLCYGQKQSRNRNEVEFVWNSPLEPPCTSAIDCKDWPNSSCNATSGGKGWCHCNANYQWNRTAIACTQVGNNPRQSGEFGQFGSSEKKHKSISLKTRKKNDSKKTRERREGNQALQMYDMERSVKSFLDSSEFKEGDKKGIDVPVFNLESILEATNYFSDENKLGQGGFGPVYKGNLPERQEIAIKRLSSHSGQGLEEFKNEVVLIAKLQHRNLVRLLGYCIKGDEKILLYEYMPNKSLDTFIFDPSKQANLDWTKRFQIIEGITQGLIYLQKYSRLKVIHRDLKASNILLDEAMNPKISDFGTARSFGINQIEANTRRVVGTYGYMSPEYALYGKFSKKSDVFSIGVLMLEIVSGKRNTSFHLTKLSLTLLGWAWRFWREEKALDLMDQTLLESCNRGEVMKCITVGLLCVQEKPSDRPSMPNVVFMLGSETATLPNPKSPAFLAKNWLSNAPSSSSSSSKPETFSNSALTVSVEEGR
ncbi:hypothetical protein ACSBR2_027596 [Camellia fascicularis]